MAAGLGFKDFVTGEVLTAADVDGYLMQGIWVFANAAARTSAVTSPQEGNYSFLKDTNSTEYYDGSAWVAVGGGGGGGKVLQVVQGTLTSAASTSGSSYVDTGLTVSITPSSATSKIYVTALLPECDIINTASATGAAGGFRLLRGATQLQQGIFGSFGNTASSNRNIYQSFQFIYLDSPATTSSTTYKVQFVVNTGTTVTTTNSATQIAAIVVMEIGA